MSKFLFLDNVSACSLRIFSYDHKIVGYWGDIGLTMSGVVSRGIQGG